MSKNSNQDAKVLVCTADDILASFCPGKRYTRSERRRFEQYINNLRTMSIRVVNSWDDRNPVPLQSSKSFFDELVDTYDGFDFTKHGGRRIPSLQVANGLPSAEPLPVANVTETLEVVELPRKPAVSKQTLDTRDHAVLLLKAKLQDWQYLGRLVTGRHVNAKAQDAIIAYENQVRAHAKTEDEYDRLSIATRKLMHTLKMKCDGTYAKLWKDPDTKQLVEQIVRMVGD